MARPQSEDRRNAILEAAGDVVATDGLGASTAAIAKAAGVSNGSLFVYFVTKAALVNALFVTLKTEMGAAALDGLVASAEPREQLRHLWNNWLDWAIAFPAKRRALAQLTVSGEITPESHRAVGEAFAGIADLLERTRADGPLAGATLRFVLDLLNAVAETTIDSLLRDPDEAALNRRLGFDALWRILV